MHENIYRWLYIYLNFHLLSFTKLRPYMATYETPRKHHAESDKYAVRGSCSILLDRR